MRVNYLSEKKENKIGKREFNCQLSQLNFETRFRYLYPDKDCILKYNAEMWNYIVFVLKGSCRVVYGREGSKGVTENHFFLFARSENVEVEVLGGSQILLLEFNMPLNPCDLQMIRNARSSERIKSEQPFLLPVQKPLDVFIKLLVEALKTGMNCYHYHRLKHKELFLYFRQLYSLNELKMLFHPLIGRSQDFHYLILQNYQVSDNMEQLISLSNMSRGTFYKRFIREFGMTPHKWMLKQKVKQIHLKSMEPGVTIKALMDQSGFDTPSNFTRFCKQHFGCTPVEMVQKNQASSK